MKVKEEKIKKLMLGNEKITRENIKFIGDDEDIIKAALGIRVEKLLKGMDNGYIKNFVYISTIDELLNFINSDEEQKKKQKDGKEKQRENGKNVKNEKNGKNGKNDDENEKKGDKEDPRDRDKNKKKGKEKRKERKTVEGNLIRLG